MPKFGVILPAAGRSTRFGDARRKKPFLDLKGRAVWLRSTEAFVHRDDVVQTIVAVAADDMAWFKERFQANLAFLDVELVEGGAERVDTVERALSRIRADVEFVAVHDAARPLIAEPWIDAVFEAAAKSGAAIPAVPVAATLKRVEDGAITETVDRRGLWQAQTPQVFRADLLREAFAQRGDFVPTDEAQLVERIGHAVTVVEGSPMNFKITTRDDFEMAKSVVDALPKKQVLRPLHPFADEEPRGLF